MTAVLAVLGIAGVAIVAAVLIQAGGLLRDSDRGSEA